MTESTGPPSLADLTTRQREVALLVASGFRNQQIAATLRVSDRTVRSYVGSLERCLGLESGKDTRVLIARWWFDHAA